MQAELNLYQNTDKVASGDFAASQTLDMASGDTQGAKDFLTEAVDRIAHGISAGEEREVYVQIRLIG